MPFDPRDLVGVLGSLGSLRGSPAGNAFAQTWQRLTQQQQQQEQQQTEQRTRQNQLGLQEMQTTASMQNMAADNQRAEREQRVQFVKSLPDFLGDETLETPEAFEQRYGVASRLGGEIGVELGFLNTFRPTPNTFVQRQARKVVKRIEGDKRFQPHLANPDFAAQLFEDAGETKSYDEWKQLAGQGGPAAGSPALPQSAGAGFTLGEGQTRFNAQGRVIARGPPKSGRLTAPETQETEWVLRNGKPLQIPKGTAQSGDTPYDPITVRQTAGASAGPSPYAAERSVRILQSVDELMVKVNGWTTGFGSLLSRIPATEARNFEAELNTLKANIAFGELVAMREASKTGGALGQVSDKEGQLLQSALGALDTGQEPANIKAQLQKIHDSLERWYRAKGLSLPEYPRTPQEGDERPIPGIRGGVAVYQGGRWIRKR